MAHFLNSCKVFDDMLAAVYDTMYTRGIRVDERDLFSAMNVYIIKVMAYLQPKFEGTFLRQANLLMSMVFNLSDSFSKLMEQFETLLADAFWESLKFDTNGNLLAQTRCAGNSHTMMLNHLHKPTRHITEEERLDKVKTDLLDVKEKIKTNIIQNVREQCDVETYYYYWSGLDLSVKLSILERKDRLRDLALFCTTKIHTAEIYNPARNKDRC